MFLSIGTDLVKDLISHSFPSWSRESSHSSADRITLRRCLFVYSTFLFYASQTEPKQLRVICPTLQWLLTDRYITRVSPSSDNFNLRVWKLTHTPTHPIRLHPISQFLTGKKTRNETNALLLIALKWIEWIHFTSNSMGWLDNWINNSIITN